MGSEPGVDPVAAHEEEAFEPPSLVRRVWDQVSTLVVAVLIALTIRSVVIEPFRIPSGSMLPTLLIGDHLFVNKFVYGARIPFTDWHLPAWRDPERGDIVVFQVARGKYNQIHPADKRPELPRDDFVKRILGMPGDVVEIDGDTILINGEPLHRERIQGEAGVHVDDDGHRLDAYWEDLLGCGHVVLDDPSTHAPAPSQRLEIPEDRYFMVGDNRDNSRDSRAWGTVQRKDFKGPAFVLYWSWSVNGNVLEFLNPVNWWRADKRWDRLFKPVGCGDPAGPDAG